MRNQANHSEYMQRALDLAKLGSGSVAPNPMVGAVLVHEGRIIGEGYHRNYGEGHAEVNCINSVAESDLPLLPESTIYVTLEPCAHFGKTPPCADLIISKAIGHVVIGSRDPFDQVNGRGIGKLLAAGIQVETGVLEEECQDLNRRFFHFHTRRAPWIILKWAQTANGIMGSGTEKRLMITNEYSNRLVHRWRSEEMAILIGAGTASADDPSLTTRHWPGKNPLRIVIDPALRLKRDLKIFNGDAGTIVFNLNKDEENNTIRFVKMNSRDTVIKQICDWCYMNAITSVIVEGGQKTLQHFIDSGIWNEMRILTNTSMFAKVGVAAPSLPALTLHMQERLGNDLISYFINPI